MSILQTLSIAAVVALLVGTHALATDHCNTYHNCQTCVEQPFCGWCSTKVVYKSGAAGHHCAGFNKNKSNDFICYGVYSTDTCERGYVCNTTTYTCDKTAPGKGELKSACEANCTTIGKTFECDNKTHTCKVAPAGEGTSLPICEQSCANPNSHAPQSHAPASMNPASHHPSSHEPESPSPTPAPTYSCNTSSLKCVEAQPGHGASKAVCEASCKPSNHTPTDLKGLWRGFPISDGAELYEWDFDFAKDSVKIAVQADVVTCSVSEIGTEGLDLLGCTGSGSPKPKVSCLWQMTNQLPETFSAMIACNWDGGAAPSSFDEAMLGGSGGGNEVLLLQRCVPDGYCKFHFGNGSSTTASASSFFAGAKKAMMMPSPFSAPVVPPTPAPQDPCSQYGDNCTKCIAHPDCGWCSTNVVYNDGAAGTRCAGFNPDGKANPFKCSGSYSTDECYKGYKCEPANQTCVPTAPGTGLPKADCTASCKAHHHPPVQLLGVWRGIAIDNGYMHGVFVMNMTNDGAVMTWPEHPTRLGFTANVSTAAGQIFFKFLTPSVWKGQTLSCLWSNDQNELVEFVDIACGGFNEAAPTGYKKPMKHGAEWVMAKCASKNCKW